MKRCTCIFVLDNSLPGIIKYPTDLPSICWPTSKDFTCWNHLLSNITRIHVIHMNHLDVGYNGIPTMGFINNILNIYFHQYLPRAAILAEQIRRISLDDSFIYTTHPWLLTIRTGTIAWHAGAMNMQYQWMNERVLNISFDLSVSLAKRFNVPVPCVISLRDVPGIPITIIRSLNQYFSQYCSYRLMITVGVNAGITGFDIPKGLFRWGTSYPNNPGSTFTNPGGLSLNDLVIVPQIGVGLAFAFRTDNQGPPMSIAEIHQTYEILRQSYPGARIIASSFQNFLEDISTIGDELELFDHDISNLWLQGIGSYPKRIQQYQALQRALNTCFERNLCTINDDQLIDASRYLIKVPVDPTVVFDKAEVDEAEVGEASVNKVEFNEAEVVEAEIGAAEVGEASVNKVEFNEAEVVEAEIGAAEVVEAEVGAAEVVEAEIGATEVVDAEVGEVSINKVEVNEAEVGAAEVVEAEVGATEVDKGTGSLAGSSHV
ncbi:unnamed protein product [Rotaria sordida]|uniref:Uncharacterized protein n=1 Tax=Rotaria sordida TaxID=392033 RepID=A0A815GRX6_9BILA|nr:unnamed protein product [Rotaria sordida]CAF1597658.1 unnamed protein product [Rotaria sordida]